MIEGMLKNDFRVEYWNYDFLQLEQPQNYFKYEKNPDPLLGVNWNRRTVENKSSPYENIK